MNRDRLPYDFAFRSTFAAVCLAVGISLLFAGMLPCARAQGLQRYLASLRIGDTLEDIRKIYPPLKSGSSYKEPGGEIVRIEADRKESKRFPVNVSRMRLRLRKGHLVHLQLIYDDDYSRRRSLEDLVMDYSLIYGEPRRRGEAYWWGDSSVVLRLGNIELPAAGGVVELRLCAELIDRDLFDGRY
ncbi:MAG: hypothetical protein WCU88_11380 [Elusimicrobiota bacterium]